MTILWDVVLWSAVEVYQQCQWRLTASIIVAVIMHVSYHTYFQLVPCITCITCLHRVSLYNYFMLAINEG
jgi:hypothetical protein